MKVAFDATVVHGSKSGVGYYAQELLRALVRQESGTEYFVFSHRKLDSGVVDAAGGVEFSSSRFCPVRALYLHALLPGLLNRVQPDVVHYTNFLAPIRGPKPYVVTIHDMSLERLPECHSLAKRLYTRRLIPASARGARLVLTNSEYSRWETVRYLGIPEDRIRVTPLAASEMFRPPDDTTVREVTRRYGVAEPYFLYVGNIEPRKNLELLVDAFAGLPASAPGLVIAGGPGFEGSRVAARIARRVTGRRVRFLGYVARRDLPGLMGGATAFVYPSLLEGFGLPVLEAMASGVPVVTSSTSALGDLARGAALTIDPTRVDQLRDALDAVSRDPALGADLRRRGLARAAEFSWRNTATATHDGYREALDRGAPVRSSSGGTAAATPARAEQVRDAVRNAMHYADQFDYPLTPDEIRDRLAGVAADRDAVHDAIRALGVDPGAGFVQMRPGQAEERRRREAWSDHVLDEFRNELRWLASVPFIRMLAFTGATAHRNMQDRDIDLFTVVEDRRLWATLALVTLWARARGLRRNICMNYLVSDRALAIPETDLFTAQQAASMKPFYGKRVYDDFLRANPFVVRSFPNFNADRHREFYAELHTGRLKRALEVVLSLGPIQLLEVAGRRVCGRHIERKASGAANLGPFDVVLESRRIKLHLNSHRAAILARVDASAGDSVPGPFAPGMAEREKENAHVEPE
jgi:alpha-1,3-rhamnosyl/mannosyltransferase